MNRDYLLSQRANFQQQREVAMARANQATGALAAIDAILADLDKPALASDAPADNPPAT